MNQKVQVVFCFMTAMILSIHLKATAQSFEDSIRASLEAGLPCMYRSVYGDNLLPLTPEQIKQVTAITRFYIGEHELTDPLLKESFVKLREPCKVNQKETHRLYLVDGSTSDVGEVPWGSQKEKSAVEFDDIHSQETGTISRSKMEFNTLLKGEGNAVGRLHEMARRDIGTPRNQNSQYWNGPGILNIGITKHNIDTGELGLDPNLGASAVIASDVWNTVCADFRSYLNEGGDPHLYFVHFVGKSRGGSIMVEVIDDLYGNQPFKLNGCINTNGKIPKFGSAVLIDPVLKANGGLVDWAKDFPAGIDRQRILVLEKSIEEKHFPKDQNFEKFKQLSILKAMAFANVNHKYVYKDGKLEDRLRTDATRDQVVDHHEIGHELITMIGAAEFVMRHGICLSLMSTRSRGHIEN